MAKPKVQWEQCEVCGDLVDSQYGCCYDQNEFVCDQCAAHTQMVPGFDHLTILVPGTYF